MQILTHTETHHFDQFGRTIDCHSRESGNPVTSGVIDMTVPVDNSSSSRQHPVSHSRRRSLRWIAAGGIAATIPRSFAASTKEHPEALRTVAVHGEFGALKSAIVNDGSTARTFTMDEQRKLIAPEALRAHPETGPSTRERLIAQHRRLREVLAENGVALIDTLPQTSAPYQVFARDPSFVIGRTLYVASLKDPWRHSETAGLREIRSQFADVVSLSSSQAAIEGGDVMILDGTRKVLIGINRNTTEAGFRALAEGMNGSAPELIRVPHEALHLDCCLAPLPDGSALYAADKLPETSVRALRSSFEKMIPLDQGEASVYLAANLLWLDAARVISGSAAKKTNALLRRRGFDVIELDYSELVALWGSIRCTVCPVERSITG